MDELTGYAKSFIGIPYIWGGNNPLQGFDCSGYLQWILRSVGLDPRGDQTAQAFLDHFQTRGSHGRSRPGTLLFFGRSLTRISHCALLLNPYQMIHAAGGDSTTLTIEDAAKRGACVRIDLIQSRKDLQARIFPNYETIGVI